MRISIPLVVEELLVQHKIATCGGRGRLDYEYNAVTWNERHPKNSISKNLIHVYPSVTCCGVMEVSFRAGIPITPAHDVVLNYLLRTCNRRFCLSWNSREETPDALAHVQHSEYWESLLEGHNPNTGHIIYLHSFTGSL